MESSDGHEEWAAAFQRATWGCAPAIGRALGLSPRTIQQWGQATNEKRGPGERLEMVIRIALEHRKPHDALAPLHLLANRFGYRLEPDIEGVEGDSGDASLARRAAEAMMEAGEAVNTALAALDDGIISSEEMDAINRECDEAIEALIRLKRVAQAER